MLNIENYSKINVNEKKGYDCLECGHKTSVLATDGIGTCQTPGCLYENPIQFVYYPNWQEPKISRAGRIILFM
jgi:ribosomal protein L37AE/L43A